MKIAWMCLLLAVPALAQQPTAPIPAACGSNTTAFEVTVDPSQHTLQQSGAGKALVYFIQDDGPDGNHQHFITKVALDGAWVGAYKNNSYFAVSVEPGVHHVCARVQSKSRIGDTLALAHFTAEAGKTYYFTTRFPGGLNALYPVPPYLLLSRLDSDEADYLISLYPLSISHPKK